MKVHPEMLMKTKDRENLHGEIGAKFGAEETTSHAEDLSQKTKRRTWPSPEKTGSPVILKDYDPDKRRSCV